MLLYIERWLKASAQLGDGTLVPRQKGTPQGGVISPLLANLYINRMLKGFRQTGREEQFKARIVNYADDFVILSRGKAKEALEWTRGVLERLKLTLNEKKTSIRNARQERFDFLGYTFGPHFSQRTGRAYLSYSPSAKSRKRLRENVRGHLGRGNMAPWEEVRDRLNQKLRGWAQYFQLKRPWKAFDQADAYVEDWSAPLK
jgi:RNA-directed DNA polymerase